MNRLDGLKIIFETYGCRNQLKKMGEETFELFEAMSDYKANQSMQNLAHVAEEVADCMVLTTQFMLDLGALNGWMDRVNEITARRMESGIGYSSMFLYHCFQDFADEYLSNINGLKDSKGWAMEKLCAYASLLEIVQIELHIDSDKVIEVADQKIKRQMERVKNK